MFDRYGTIKPSSQELCANLQFTLSVLKLTKSENLLRNPKFLDGKPLTSKIALTSYPGTDIEPFVFALESLTGITIGSSSSLHTGTLHQVSGRCLAQSVVDDTVWMVKTHHPMF